MPYQCPDCLHGNTWVTSSGNRVKVCAKHAAMLDLRRKVGWENLGKVAINPRKRNRSNA